MSFRYGPGFLAALLTIANVLIPLAVFTFATGFFPYKPVLPGLAQYEALEYGPPPQAPFDRLIFMVVDALRSDFVYLNGTGFTYTQELIRDGAALPFTAYARSPTVTMPRIKAITTGSIPSFLDVILNLDEADSSSTLAAQDTWLAQMKAKETGKMLMYGDDTWLKLFPGTFDRADGTASFFVADFTEVDNNVTRHIDSELKNDDWSTLVLHYLGLDHIGHKSGPRSSHMVPKQHEMDGIVKRIYNAMESRDHMSSTLMVLCGDHGMNDAGNHGASSPGETSPALVFISPKLKALQRNLQAPVPFREDFSYYTKIEQSDLAPTLGALLGFPVPQNNLGAFISDFLPFWPDRNDQIQLLVRNARQILNIVTVTFGFEMFDLGSTFDQKTCSNPRDDAQELACEWHRVNDALKTMDGEAELDPAWREAMSKWLSRAQDLMSSMASNYDMGRLHIGEAVVGLVAGSLIFGARLSLIPLLAISVTYGIMMFASSYVEEEHHFWYWATSAWLGSMGIRKMQSTRSPSGTLASLLIALTATRLIRGWNQTGQKHAGEPDIAKTFIVTHPPILWTLVSVTYLFLFVQLLRKLRGLPRAAVTAASALLVLSAFTFKLAFTNEDAPELVTGPLATLNTLTQGISLVTRARLVFAGIGAAALYSSYLALSNPKTEARHTSPLLHHLITLLLATQSRVTNIPLLLLFTLQLPLLASLDLSLPLLSTTSLLLQYASFFAFGGTNAISSVDLSSAYNGVGGFNVVAVGILTFVSNWVGPIYWASATNLLLLQYRGRRAGSDEGKYVFLRHVGHTTLFTACSVAFIMVACEALRTHLFVWTVFSPKYLYCMAWTIGQHLLVNVVFAGLLYRLGSA
ncbi:GPI ethanolamine phosphate transferase [Colletotrichum scovillei]|uniref:GPI ethanolamine phosphate transferase 2 n=1 Tax=Colletotrichum scovillei TaxID=1209932 RepID=A0A9P7UD00_9PEZI|nr:GPI ethanolamine phosphate transferase [Colletotrichum scovillei]KAF4783318.1 GPI ethanolamine phosphate transferase [Colletotrichum scovillei]KAG7051514.1 GPI ethanolamine phosphate transferase [Colletotrichum scovillei]KAG7070550.1 GPI ethanolamine phosphate transferase [Colletotrichum scovillei]KAG7078801.1 GPI ethanolamine phosphate transferase [Colletotrichum scovillei]